MKAGIDNAAHIGGLLSGFLLGIIYVCSYKFEKADAQRTVSILGELGIFCICLLYTSFSNIKNNPILQSVYFTPVNARYVQLKATRMIHDSEPMGLAEIGIQ